MLRLAVLCVFFTLAYGVDVEPTGSVPPMRVVPKLYVTRDFGLTCIGQCFNLPPSNIVNATAMCVQQCVEALVHSIEDWLEDLPQIPDMRSAQDTRTVYDKLYVDGTNLQQQLLALQRATQRPGGILDALFPNLPSFGIFRPPSNAQQGFASRPQFPGLIMQVIQTVTNLLAQVIQKQHDILQVIIGCSPCNETTTMPPMMTSPGSMGPFGPLSTMGPFGPTTMGPFGPTTTGSTTTSTPFTTGTPPTTNAAGR